MILTAMHAFAHVRKHSTKTHKSESNMLLTCQFFEIQTVIHLQINYEKLLAKNRQKYHFLLMVKYIFPTILGALIIAFLL